MAAPSSNMVDVIDANAKLMFLARNRDAYERGGFDHGLSGLARRIMQVRLDRGLSLVTVRNYHTTLRTAAENNKIDADNETILAELCGFDKTSAAWRSGTLKAFQESFSGAQYLVSRTARPRSILNAVSVQIFFPQDGKPAAWPYDIEAICQKATLTDIGLSLNISRLVVRATWDMNKFPGPHASRARDRAMRAAQAAKALGESKLEISIIGDDRAPGWEIWHPEGERIGVVPLDKICDLHEVVDGLEVVISLTVFDKDLNAQLSASDIAQEEDEEPPAILRADGTSLGPNKLKVLQAIAALSLKEFGDQPPGSARLASDSVTFKKR